MRPYIVIFLALFFIASCSDDNNSTNNGVFPQDTGKKDVSNKTDTSNDTSDTEDMDGVDGTDSGQNDMSDSGTGEDMAPDVINPACKPEDCGVGEGCVDDVCKIINSCEAVKDLGELVIGTPITETGSFTDSGADNIESSCAIGLERVFSFTLTTQARVNFAATWNGQFDGAVSFRNDCDDDGSEISCSDIEAGFRIMEPGTYFVVLEVKFGNPDAFELELDAVALACTPGEGMCVGDELSFCTVNQPTLYACADTCTANACDGDECSAPVTVAGQGGAFSGDAFDYEDSYNFENNVTCPLITDGYDVVYSLGTLDPGNILNVKSSPFNAVFIMKGMNTCGDTTGCVVMYDGISDIDYVIPPLEGDEYYVIIDSKSAVQPSSFDHEINIPNR